MSVNKSRRWQVVPAAILSTLIFFAVGEFIFRAAYPEYQNSILNADMSLGKRRYKNFILGGETRSRTKDLDIRLVPGDQVVLVFGDSVSFGYGLAYEDIYWNYWQRMLDLEGVDTKIVCITDYGNNSTDNISFIKKVFSTAKEERLDIRGVVYQFNFNDILPYKSDDLKHFKHLHLKSNWVSKIVLQMAYFRTHILNYSVMLRVLSNKLAHLFFNNAGVPCEDLGYDGLGDYSYSFGGKNSIAAANKLWVDFETDLVALLADTRPTPFALMVTPIPQFLDPTMVIHDLSRPKRFDCATINPVQRLKDMSQRLNFYLVDPTDYMKKYFENYVQGKNPESFFHINDDNHPNTIGSKYLAEYSYFKIFTEGIVPVVPRK